MQNIVLEHLGTNWEVTYKIAGKYYPATPEQPAEYPQVCIIRVEPCDPDWYDDMVRAGEIKEDYFESGELEDIFCAMITELEFN